MNRATDGGTSRFNCAGTAARASSQSGVGRVQSSMPVSYGVAVTLVVTHLHNGRQGGLADSHTEARKHLERKFERLHFRGDLAKRDRGWHASCCPASRWWSPTHLNLKVGNPAITCSGQTRVHTAGRPRNGMGKCSSVTIPAFRIGTPPNPLGAKRVGDINTHTGHAAPIRDFVRAARSGTAVLPLRQS